MRNLLVLLTLGLLLTGGCDRRDAKLRQQLSGTWERPGEQGQITLNPNGRFDATWAHLSISNTPIEFSYEGTWAVTNQMITLMKIKSDVKGADYLKSYLKSTSQIEHWKIVRLDPNHAILGYGNQTNTFVRKR